MAKKLSINEKEVFDIFKNYDKTSILFKYKYTEQEKKSEDALNRSLRRKWIATLKKKGIKPNDMIEGDNATMLLFFFIVELNGANFNTLSFPENEKVLKEAKMVLSKLPSRSILDTYYKLGFYIGVK